MANTNAQMIASVIKTLPNMTEASSKQVLADWLKNPGQMFQDNSNTNFLNTLATFVLDRIRVSDFYNPLENENVVQRYSQNYGNIQRLYVGRIPTVDADFQKPWENGSSSDMFKKRVIQPTQKFARSNISYNNRVSVPGAMFYTSTFADYAGLVDWQMAIQTEMLQTYSRWRGALYLDVIGRQTTSADLKDDQKIAVSIADENSITEEEAKQFALQVLTLKSVARLNAKPFNEAGFEYTLNPENLKVLVRPGVKAKLQIALVNAFNPAVVEDVINTLVEVPYLGVPEYYQDEGHTTKLYPVYDANGMIIGLNTTEGASTSSVSLDAAYVSDGAANIFAIAIDNRRISYVTAVGADGESTEFRTDWTIYNIEGDYRNFYTRVLGNPSEGSGARLFADTSYAFVTFVNTAASA